VGRTARLATERRRVRQRKQRGIAFHFPAGTRIFGPDHPTHRFYQLTSGHLELQNGPAAIVDQLTPGDFFGEKCFLARRRNDQVATALSPVVVTAYRKSELLHGLRRDSRFAGQFLRNLSLRLDRYENAIRDFVTEPAERRLARLLFRFMPTRPTAGWIRLPLRATNVELGRMVGTTRWRVSHLLNHFQRLGWLSRRHKELLIYREGLKQFLESPTRKDLRPQSSQEAAIRSHLAR
jgi:CRP-like cAMP-binding protein